MNKMKFKYLFILIFLIGSLPAQDWDHLGPPGGRVISLSINPFNPYSVYTSTNGAGLFHSIDSGQSVSIINHEFCNYNIYNIIQLGSSTESFICYVLGYLKRDGISETWIMINDEKSWGGGFTINPKNSDIIYISKNDSKLWRSNDGGNTWYKLHTFNEKLRIIEVSHTDTSLIYAAVDNAIYMSVNSGNDWVKSSAPSAFNGSPYKLVINPLNNNSIFLHNEGRLLKSCNSGFSFDTLFAGNVYTFAVNTLDTLTLYVGTGDPVFAPDGGIVKSIDSGLNWFEVRNGFPGGFIQCNRLEINPLNPDELYAGINDYGVYRTTDGGDNWQLTNLANTTQYGWGFLLTENNGNSWYYPNFDPEVHFYDPFPFQVAINPEDSDLGFTAGYFSLYKTSNGGKNWYTTGQLPGVHSVEYHPYNSSIIFAGANNDFGEGGRYRSLDGGEIWDKLEDSDYIPAYPVYSSHNLNKIFGYGHSFLDDDDYVYRSHDMGEGWELLYEGLIRWEQSDKVAEILSLAISYADSNILYCGQWGGLSKSIDEGDSWFQVDSSLEVHPYFKVSSILLDETDPDRIYIGTLSSGIPYTGNFDNGGLYLSEDDCQSWIKVYDGEVSLIKTDQSTPRNLYINTQYGILTLEDTITKNNGDINHKTPGEYLLYQNYPNPFNPSTTIEFDLPKSANVRIEAYNIAGQKIKTLLNKKMLSGRHEVEFNAQNLSSGIYFYRIEAGEFQDVKKMILLK
jgi:photosystem II stability/assembly factor-like uncharacterized protein